MCIVCQTISVGAAALTGILPITAPEIDFRTQVPVTFSQSVNQSASIGGTNCKRIGQIRNMSVGSFRCTAVGNRRVWRRSARPTTTTTTVLPTTTTTTTVPTLRSVVYDDIIKRAALARTKPSNAAFEFRIAPSISATRAQELKEAIIWAFIPWENQTAGAGLRVVVVDEQGRGGEDFFKANWPAGGGNCPGTPRPGGGPYVGPTQYGYVGFGCWNGDGDHVLLMGFGSSANLSPASNFIHHEITHLAQAGIYFSRPNGTELPCFLGEGEATLYGGALGDGPAGGETSHQLGRNLARELASENSLKSDSDWLTYLKLRETRDQTCNQRNFSYFVGQLYMEKLYSDFGVEKISTWKSRLPGQDWRVPFQQVFGVSPSQWYSTSLISYLRESCTC